MRTISPHRAWAGGAVAVATALSAAPAAAQFTAYSTRTTFRSVVGSGPTDVFDGLAAGTVIARGGAVGNVVFDLSDATSGFRVTTAGAKVSNPNALEKVLAGGGVSAFRLGDVITFSFVSPVTFFGVSFNASGAGGGLFTLATNSGQVFTSGYDPFPGLTTGQFAGFVSGTAVSSVTVRVTPGNDVAFGLDDLLVGSQVVPEPSTYALLAGGLAGVGAVARRRRRAPTV